MKEKHRKTWGNRGKRRKTRENSQNHGKTQKNPGKRGESRKNIEKHRKNKRIDRNTWKFLYILGT